MTPRLNLNLKKADKEALLRLRDYLEEKEGNRLSLAEVGRRALHIADQAILNSI